MKDVSRHLFCLGLAGIFSLAAACDDNASDEDADATTDPVEDQEVTDVTPDPTPDVTPDPTPDAEPDTEPDVEPDSAETYTVSGEVSRTITTCPPATDGLGTLCLSLRGTVGDPDSEVAGVIIEDVDMSTYTNVVPFTILDVPDGTWQLIGFMDDDEGGCDEGIESGDFLAGLPPSPDWVEVVVDGADVTGLGLVFNNKAI
ncbi:MAG: hypothetical protein ABIJ56_21125 [Pseudomonadota bacterium]